MKKKTVIAVIAIAVLLIAAFAAWKLLTPEVSEGSKTVTLNVTHLDGTVNTYTIKTDAEFVRGALEQEGLLYGSEESYGLWVKTVDGETADENLQQWWGYNINGEMAMYGVESQVIADGDVIDFILYEGY